jgi:glycosyltransferase involved in cell wall biosynthesis
MKLLFVTPSLTYPPTRGYEVILYKHIEQLSFLHSIEIISFQSKPGIKIEGFKKICDKIHIVKLPVWRSLFKAALGFLSRYPIQVCYYRSRVMKKNIEHLLNTGGYDAVSFTLIRMAQFIPKNYPGFSILNMVDPLVFNYERSLNWRPWYVKIGLKLEISRLKRYEARYSKLFSRLTLIAEADIIDYSGLLNRQIDWIPYGTDVDHFQPDPTITRIPGMIVITGNMGYAPNIDGVIFFCREIFPLIIEKFPNACLWLVGINPSKEISHLAAHKNIKVTGYVNDIRTYLNQAMVSVCPVRLKVGTQTKVLEALSMGTPVVSTSAGNHGICGTRDVDLYVEDAPECMADKIVSLLQGEQWNKLSVNGRKFVNEKFRWDISVKKFEELLYANRLPAKHIYVAEHISTK